MVVRILSPLDFFWHYPLLPIGEGVVSRLPMWSLLLQGCRMFIASHQGWYSPRSLLSLPWHPSYPWWHWGVYFQPGEDVHLGSPLSLCWHGRNWGTQFFLCCLAGVEHLLPRSFLFCEAAPSLVFCVEGAGFSRGLSFSVPIGISGLPTPSASRLG